MCLPPENKLRHMVALFFAHLDEGTAHEIPSPEKRLTSHHAPYHQHAAAQIIQIKVKPQQHLRRQRLG
jgi:hypothetical protein